MKEAIKILISIIISATFVYHLSDSKHTREIQEMQKKYDDIIIVNSELQQKIKSADEIYEALKQRETYLNSRVRKSKQQISEQDQLIDDLISIKDNYELEKQKLDSLKVSGPNRDKKELINSLKIKTNI